MFKTRITTKTGLSGTSPTYIVISISKVVLLLSLPGGTAHIQSQFLKKTEVQKAKFSHITSETSSYLSFHWKPDTELLSFPT